MDSLFWITTHGIGGRRSELWGSCERKMSGENSCVNYLDPFLLRQFGYLIHYFRDLDKVKTKFRILKTKQ